MSNKNLIYVGGVLLLILLAWVIWKNQIADPGSPNVTVNFEETGNLAINNPGQEKDAWYLIYEQPGSAALSTKLSFTADSQCFRQSTKIVCDFEAGERAEVEGNRTGDTVTVSRLSILTSETQTRDIKLFFYNEKRDKELGGNGGVACSRDAVLPVDRQITFTNTPIQDAIRELIKGEITAAETAQGFKSEFPEEGFELIGANLKNGVLTLEFTEVPGFTTGGSCRVTILANQIIKTAQQFPEVKEVRFKPESLFQP